MRADPRCASIRRLSALVLVLGACQPDVPAADSPDETIDRSGDPRFEFSVPPASPAYPDDDAPPTVTIWSPEAGTTFASADQVVTGVVEDDLGIAALTVQVGPNVAVPAGTPDLTGEFAIPVTLVAGPQLVTVRAYDLAGNVGVDEVAVSRDVPSVGFDAAPLVTIATPAPGFSVTGSSVWVEGTTADDTGVVSVSVAVGAGAPVQAETSDGWATWVQEALLPAGGDALIRVTATDVAGNATEVTVSGSTTFIGDQQPPEVAITAPTSGHETHSGSVTVSGTAADTSGIAAVEIRVGDGPYALTATSDAWATWQATVDLAPGANHVKVRATDTSGLEAFASVVVTESSGQEWGSPETMTLTWAPAEHSESTFELDKEGLGQIIQPDVAEQILMLELDIRPLVVDTLDTIRDACGVAWWIPNTLENSCPASWDQAEINLWRLETMTPANVNVAGTSIEGMAEVADVLSTFGLLDDFDVILAAGLGIGVYDLIVGAEAVTDSLMDNLIATHPAVLPGGYIPVTMLDGLTDMATLGPTFDASGAHPGFIDGSSPTYSEVLTDDFTIFMAATSNVHWHDGVDLTGQSKVYLPLVDDQTGPTYDDVLEFDFLDPAKFWVTGLAPNPVVDLSFQIQEYDYWVNAGTSALPLPYGNGDAWKLDSWLLEPILADAAFRHYEDHRAGCDLCGGSGSGALLWEDPLFGLDETELVVGRHGYDKNGTGSADNFPYISPNPPGWLRIWTLFGLGSPPAPQYVWDMILEVSERRLLDGGVAQGQGDVSFDVEDISVGITAPEIEAALRPTMEAQKSTLSELLLGDYTAGITAPDFTLRKGADGQLGLWFAHPGDPLPGPAHSKPGFFADALLQQKVSSAVAAGSGDALHEKVVLGAAASTLYCQDTAGAVYRLELQPVVGDSVTMIVRRKVGS